MSEGNFPQQLIESVLRLEAASLYVAKVIENILASCLLFFSQVGNRSIRIGSDLILFGKDGMDDTPANRSPYTIVYGWDEAWDLQLDVWQRPTRGRGGRRKGGK